MSGEKHAFISYVKEDVDRVVDLQTALEASGINVWRDKDRLWPGMDWKIQIRDAIRSGSLAFIACFSENYALREKTYQNEELIFAAEEFRLRAPGTQWLFPVRFSDVEVPDFDLGTGRTLSSLHFTDMFGPRAVLEFSRLTQTLGGILKPQATAGTSAPLTLSSAPQDVNRSIKTLLRDPNGDIALEEIVVEIATEASKQLADEERFPLSRGNDATKSSGEWVIQVRDTLADFTKVLDPLADVFMLAGQYGLPAHEHIWTRAMSIIATAVHRDTGNTLLLALRKFPLVYLLYVTALAGVSRENYGAIRAIAVDTRVRTLDDRIPVVIYANVSLVQQDWPWIYSTIEHARKDGVEITDDYAEANRTKRIGLLFTPISDYLAASLRDRFESMFPSASEFEEQFDAAEAILDAIAADENNQKHRYLGSWVGGGRYTWRNRRQQVTPEGLLMEELEARGKAWKPLTAGLFNGDSVRAQRALEALTEVTKSIRERRW